MSFVQSSAYCTFVLLLLSCGGCLMHDSSSQDNRLHVKWSRRTNNQSAGIVSKRLDTQTADNYWQSLIGKAKRCILITVPIRTITQIAARGYTPEWQRGRCRLLKLQLLCNCEQQVLYTCVLCTSAFYDLLNVHFIVTTQREVWKRGYRDWHINSD